MWNTLRFGIYTYTNGNLITLHTLLTVKGDSIKLSIPQYNISHYIYPNNFPINLHNSYNEEFPDVLGWRVRNSYIEESSTDGESSTDNTIPYIWNPTIDENVTSQNSLLSGSIVYPTTQYKPVEVIPSIALKLIDIENISDNFRISNKRLNISRNDTNLRIQTDIDNIDVYAKEKYTLDTRNSGTYTIDTAEIEISKLTHTYKIQTIDSLYVNGREVNYKYPLSSIDLTKQTTPPSGGTTGGSGEDSGVVDGPNPPSSGVSSGVSTSTDDELNQDNL